MRFSLRLKSILLVGVVTLMIGGVSLTISSRIISNLIKENFINEADEIAATTALAVDGDKLAVVADEVSSVYLSSDDRVSSEEWGSDAFYDYVGHFDPVKDIPEYTDVLKQLKAIQSVNDVDCIYTIWLDTEGRNAVYLIDAASEGACPPGNFDPLYEINYETLSDPDRGFPAYVTESGYGWLVSAGAPVYDSKGSLVAYAFVDMSMDEMRRSQEHYIFLTGGILLFMTLLCVAGSFVIVDRFVIDPIRKISDAAMRYREEEGRSIRHSFTSLDIRTGDELEVLSESMKQMERDMNDYNTTLSSARQELVSTREEADRISSIAFMDALTGVRNKRAYDNEVKRLEASIGKRTEPFGIAVADLNYLKQINDRYGHEMGDIAIQKLCAIVCETFGHSPVFRYGGDEFVLILENRDLERIESLMREFDATVENCAANDKIKPWERVSAAMGFAIYDEKTDKTVEDVFVRADKAMYARKKEMKQRRGFSV
ncbi:MAG: GGDEF domain-containing protein [Lachnospiraceae bacterium]|nr:GGDEF domain-containing protein [Lachnospiraceae bacterium]